MKLGDLAAAPRRSATPRRAQHGRFRIALLPLACALACSSLQVEQARRLAAIGAEASRQNAASIFASDDEYARAMDAEAFFHGFANSAVPEELAASYKEIQAEFAARKIAFSALIGAYDAFSGLAASPADDELETAIAALGGAVDSYAAAVSKSAASERPALPPQLPGVTGALGGYAVGTLRDAYIRKSSARIREPLEQWARLLEDPLVRTQFVSFRENLSASRSAVVRLLWAQNLLDATPLIDQLGAEAGLRSRRDALAALREQGEAATPTYNGLSAVIHARLARKLELVEQSYQSSIESLQELIQRHHELERGQPLSLARVHQVVAELRLFSERLVSKPAQASAP